jgi:putative transposase
MPRRAAAARCQDETRRTTIADPTAARPPDLVDRQFGVPAPNRLLVADFTYVKLITGVFVYVAFVIDAYAGVIVGWEASASKQTRFVESAIRQAAAYGRVRAIRSTTLFTIRTPDRSTRV